MIERTLKARAKINLGLDVLRKRPDGYHDLRMVMQTVDLCDEITLRVPDGQKEKAERISLRCLFHAQDERPGFGQGERAARETAPARSVPELDGRPGFGEGEGAARETASARSVRRRDGRSVSKRDEGEVPADSRNLAYRAAHLLMEEFDIREGLEITLEKHIPVAAGLAGGSSDAAAVLVGANELFGLGLTVRELMERGVKLGADVPYCIMRGTALAEGIGDRLTRLPDAPRAYVLLARPPICVSTKYVYDRIDLRETNSIMIHPDIDAQVQAVRDGDLYRMAALMGNVLETVTIPAFFCDQRDKGAGAAIWRGECHDERQRPDGVRTF